jgi:hypothetical protein
LDEQNNNGLIQTEIAKRLNLNTKRIRRSFGVWAWMEPTVTLSKIEQHNRNLELTAKADSAKGHAHYYASTLPIRQHEMFSVGLNTNIGYMDVPAIKTTFSLNVGANFGRTPLGPDSLFRGTNALTLFTELDASMKTDEQWSVGVN